MSTPRQGLGIYANMAQREQNKKREAAQALLNELLKVDETPQTIDPISFRAAIERALKMEGIDIPVTAATGAPSEKAFVTWHYPPLDSDNSAFADTNPNPDPLDKNNYQVTLGKNPNSLQWEIQIRSLSAKEWEDKRWSR